MKVKICDLCNRVIHNPTDKHEFKVTIKKKTRFVITKPHQTTKRFDLCDVCMEKIFNNCVKREEV